MIKKFTLCCYLLLCLFSAFSPLQAQTVNTLSAWGKNDFGQLGNGIQLKHQPQQINDGTDWLVIASGEDYTIAIKQDGTLWAWGYNSSSQLGDGTYANRSAPVQLGTDTNWKSVSAGYSHSLAVKTDGTLWAWGSNGVGQLGDGTTIPSYTPKQIGTDTNWGSVYAGEVFSLAIRTDGTLWAWGGNWAGQLGDGTNTNRHAPVKIGAATNWSSLNIGKNHSLAIRRDGTLWAWGHNGSGQLGDGTSTARNAPVQIGTATNWKGVSAGYGHSLAVKTDGTLWAWGANSHGQLGYGSTMTSYSPYQVGTATNWSSVSAGYYHSLAIKTDASLWAWGNNSYGQVGDNTTTNRFAPVNIGIGTNWAEVSAGILHTIAISTAGTLWSWGGNGVGQLGIGTWDYIKNPVQAGIAGDWSAVSAGGKHNAGLKSNGTLWAWGRNTHGQLGDGTVVSRSAPVQVGTNTDWTSVSTGGNHSLAIKADGTLWAWGGNFNGQLGDGTTTAKSSPVKIGTATDWLAVSAGYSHSLAVKTDGTLWAWGRNFSSQLGDGSNVDRHTPVKIGTATNWKALAAGTNHSLAMREDGTLWAWGVNGDGQLGDGTTTARTAPVQVGTATDWASVSIGEKHSLAIKTDGTLWAWGSNYFGQLGEGTSTSIQMVPLKVGTAADWTAVSGGNEHTIALKADGTLWVWGNNASGQLGNGSTSKRYVPEKLGTLSDWIFISAGNEHTLALFNDKSTIKPSLHKPLEQSISGRNIDVEFTLAENAKAGTVKLVFSRSAGAEDVNSPHTITFDASFEAAGTHYITLDGNKLSAATGVASVSTAPNDLLMDGGVYTVSITYEDLYNNPAASDVKTGITYDLTPPAAPAKPALSSATDTGVSNSDGITKVTTPVLEGTAEANALVSIFTDDIKKGTTQADGNGTWSYAITEALSGDVHHIFVRASDVAGNISAASELFTIVVDIQAPTVATKDAVLQLNANGEAELKAESIDSGSTDNINFYSGLTYTLSKSSFSCSETGMQQVTLTVTDEAGNAASAAANVTVQDAIAPEIPAGQVFIFDHYVASTSEVGKVAATDNCPIQVFSISSGNTEDVFSIDSTGLITITNDSELKFEDAPEYVLHITATDATGNASTEAVTVRLMTTGLFDKREEQTSTFNVYPNPTRGRVMFDLEGMPTGENIKLSLLSIEGKVLLEGLVPLSKGVEYVNSYLMNAKAGVYFMLLQTKQHVHTARIIKE